MNIRIKDNGQLIEISIDKSVVNIAKSAIRALEPMRGNALKVVIGDTGQSCLYLDASRVVQPEALTDNDDLRQYFAMLINTGGSEGEMNSLLEQLIRMDASLHTIDGEVVNSTNSLNRSLVPMADFLNQIRNILDGAYNAYKSPLRIDETVSGVTYYGYAANVAAFPSQPAWAIKRTKKSGGLTTSCWANGSRDLVNAWDDRLVLNYIPG